MAKIFSFTPSQVDEIPLDQVMEMLHLDSEWRKKEAEEVSNSSKRK